MDKKDSAVTSDEEKDSAVISDEDVIACSIDTYPNGISLFDMPQDDMIVSITEQYLEGLDMNDKYDTEKIKSELYHLTISFINMRKKRNKNETLEKRPTLYPVQIALIILKFYHIKMIDMRGDENGEESDYLLLAIYQEAGENEGIYLSHKREFVKLILRYNRSIKEPEIKQIITYLGHNSEVVSRSYSPVLVPVQNGIFNLKTKRLDPFTPDIIFTSKCRVRYNPCADQPVVLYNDKDGTVWEIEKWIEDMFDHDLDIVEVIWQILGALIRTGISWEKCIWLYSTRGNNGKGTLCELMRNLVGRDMCVSLKIADFRKEFMLEPLIHASAIITDENDVGKYVDEAANFKAIITGDVITINRKNRVPVTFRPRMLQVQCVNEMPQFRDKSESLYRRQLIIEFKKSFTGQERKYIKHDYMSRKEVLEYVLYKVLHMDYTEIKETPSMKAAMEKYKLSNEPVRDFLEEILGETCLDFLPQSFLWDAFKAWSNMNNPHGTIPKRNRFLEEMRDIMENNPDWEYHANPVHVYSLLHKIEPLLQKYGLREWGDQYPSHEYVSNVKCNMKHRGYKRVSAGPITAAPTGNTDCGLDTEDKTS